MKKNIRILQLSVIILLISSVNYGQTTFSYFLSTQCDERIFDAAEDEMGNYYFVGRKYDPNTLLTSAYFMVLSPSGELIYEREFSNTDTSSYFSNIYIKNDSIVIFGAKGLSTNEQFNELWYLQLDINYNVVQNNFYILESYDIADIAMIISSEGNYILCGTVYSPIQSQYFDIFLSKISPIGDSLSLSILQLDNIQIGCDLMEQQNGGYKVYCMGVFPNAPPSNGTIVVFDSIFNYISADSVPYDLRNNHSAKRLSDSTYLLTGKKSIPNPYKADMGIIKLDMNDELIKTTYFGKTGDTNHHVGACSNLDFISNDNIYFGGTSNVIEGHLMYQPEDSWILLNNVDTELNLNWQKFYGGEAFYYLWGLKATNDGGCLLMATRYDADTQDHEFDVFILKVDSTGLLTSTGDYPSIPIQQLSISPNPTQDYVKIGYPDIFGNEDKEIVIYNSLGMLVRLINATDEYSKITIDISDLPGGLYFISLSINRKNVASGKVVKI